LNVLGVGFWDLEYLYFPVIGIFVHAKGQDGKSDANFTVLHNSFTEKN